MDKSKNICQNTDCYGKKQDNPRNKSNQEAQHTGGDAAGIRWSRLSAVFLILLCVLLLVRILMQGLMLHNLTKEKHQLYMERDQLQRKVSELDTALQQHSKYFLSPLKNWTAARQYCRSKQADLVIINSREEQEFISTYFESFEAWIGLTDQDQEGEWKWVDNTKTNTTFWWEGEPNDWNNNEDCVVTGSKFATSNVSTWADYPCFLSVLGICERGIDFEMNSKAGN